MLFRDISLTDAEQVEKLRTTYGSSASIYLFSSLYIWKTELKLTIHLRSDCFIIKYGKDSDRSYFFPVGSEQAKQRLLRELLRGGRVELFNLTAEDCRYLDAQFPGKFQSVPDRDSWEYLYDRREQVELEGSAFRHIRKKVNNGMRLNEWEVRPLVRANVELAAMVTREWGRQRQAKRGYADVDATMLALSFYQELGLSGIVLLAHGEPHAFALGAYCGEDTYNLKLSKTLESDVDWYLKWELYRQLPESIRLINREDDMGIAGLRTHKTEMKPCGFIEMYRSIVI